MKPQRPALEWEGGTGDRWVQNQVMLDRWLAPLGALALEAVAATPGSRVLDVGCGCGASSLDLSRSVGPAGRVVAVDVSSPMLARARERAASAGLEIEFRHGDAAEIELAEGAFDRLHSRFGLMFFEDPAAAFARLVRALRPGSGRMGFVCWQGAEVNAWATATVAATEPALGPAPPREPGPGPFAMADADALRELLDAAGCGAIEIVGRQMRLEAGTVAEAVDLFGRGVGPVARRLGEAAPHVAARALEDLGAAFGADYVEPDGVVRLPVAAWVVTATRRS